MEDEDQRTPEQVAARKKEVENFIRELYDKLPHDEAKAWVDAWIEDQEQANAALQDELAFAEELLDILLKYGGIDEAFKAIKKSQNRTPADF